MVRVHTQFITYLLTPYFYQSSGHPLRAGLYAKSSIEDTAAILMRYQSRHTFALLQDSPFINLEQDTRALMTSTSFHLSNY
jgi:hypothetical protein